MSANNRFVRQIKLGACKIARTDLPKLFRILSDKVKEAGDLQVRDWQMPPGDTDFAKFENTKESFRKLFETTTVIYGVNGEVRSGQGAGMIAPENLPDRIASIYFTSNAMFAAVQKSQPRASLELLLDFKKPALLDFSSPASAPTANASFIKVESDDENWTNATFQKIKDFFDERHVAHNFLHRTNVYDFGLVIVGFPCSFWIAWKAVPLIRTISVDESTGILRAALYVYAFLTSLWLYRVVFSYAKWAFPLLEIDSPRNSAAIHRGVLLVIILGVVGAFAHDLIQAIF